MRMDQEGAACGIMIRWSFVDGISSADERALNCMDALAKEKHSSISSQQDVLYAVEAWHVSETDRRVTHQKQASTFPVYLSMFTHGGFRPGTEKRLRRSCCA